MKKNVYFYIILLVKDFILNRSYTNGLPYICKTLNKYFYFI